MTVLNRRGLLGAGSAMLAFAALGDKKALAAGSPGLTTHVLDTANGKPGEGIKIEFSVLEGDTYKLLATAMKKQNKVALARWVAANREHLVILRPFENHRELPS